MLRFGVVNTCIDEGARPTLAASVIFLTTDTATGKFVSEFGAGSVFPTQPKTFAYAFVPTDTPPATTLTVNLVGGNGKIATSRSITYAQALQSVPQSVA
jgi:hypothetical protein